MGERLEVCWPYKENGKTVKIWALGTVKRVADGLADTRSKTAQKVLPAGAILWAWDADPDYQQACRGEVALPAAQALEQACPVRMAARPVRAGIAGPPAAPRVDQCASDDEYLTDDERMQDWEIFGKLDSL